MDTRDVISAAAAAADVSMAVTGNRKLNAGDAATALAFAVQLVTWLSAERESQQEFLEREAARKLDAERREAARVLEREERRTELLAQLDIAREEVQSAGNALRSARAAVEQAYAEHVPAVSPEISDAESRLATASQNLVSASRQLHAEVSKRQADRGSLQDEEQARHAVTLARQEQLEAQNALDTLMGLPALTNDQQKILQDQREAKLAFHRIVSNLHSEKEKTQPNQAEISRLETARQDASAELAGLDARADQIILARSADLPGPVVHAESAERDAKFLLVEKTMRVHALASGYRVLGGANPIVPVTYRLVVESVLCKQTSESGEDEVYLKFSNSTRYPTDRAINIDEDEGSASTWHANHAVDVPSTGLTVQLCEDDDVSSDDVLGSFTVRAQISAGTESCTGDSGHYRVSWRVDAI